MIGYIDKLVTTGIYDAVSVSGSPMHTFAAAVLRVVDAGGLGRS